MNPKFNPIKPSSFVGLIGVAQRDITPPVGIFNRCWGAAKSDISDGIHLDITVTAYVFKTEPTDKPLVLIGIELPWIGADYWRGCLNKVAAVSGNEGHPENIIINLTHNHSTCPLEDIDPSIDGSSMIEPYYQQVLTALGNVVEAAIADLSPAQLTVDKGRCDLARNRDLKLEDTDEYIVAYNPSENADDTVLVGRISDFETGQIKGVFVNYACHPTTLAWGNAKLSPDFAGAMRKVIEQEVNAPSCLLQGASGELSARVGHQDKTSIADQQGRQLGYAVLSCLMGMIEPGKELAFGEVVPSGAPLGYWFAQDLVIEDGMKSCSAFIDKLPLKIKPDWPTTAEFERLFEEETDRVMKERYRRRLKGRRKLGDVQQVENNLWYWKLGNIVFFGSGFELYSNFQTTLRDENKEVPIVVMNLCNAGSGYLVPEQMYNETIYQMDVSPFAAGSLERITESASKTLQSMEN